MNATEYLLLKAPYLTILNNSFILDKELITDNIISVSVDDHAVSVAFNNNHIDTMTSLVNQLKLLPIVDTVDYADGLVMSITISQDYNKDINLSVSVAGGATQAVAYIPPLNTTSRDAFLTFARECTSYKWYKGKYEYAIALYACHLLELQSNQKSAGQVGSGGGVVSEVRQGDLSVVYFQTGINKTDKNSDLSQTSFGRELIQLRYDSNMCIGVTGSSLL